MKDSATPNEKATKERSFEKTKSYLAAESVLRNIKQYYLDYKEFPSAEDVAEDIQRFYRRKP